MSSQTTNLHLVKPAYSEAADVAVINSNMDTIDTYTSTNRNSLAIAQSGLAYIVGNTNTTGGTLSSGTYVYVKGHSSIAEGLRVTTASISNNGSITTNNTSAVSGGGLNSLSSNIANLIKYTTATKTGVTLTAGANGYWSVTYTTPSDLASENDIISVCPYISQIAATAGLQLTVGYSSKTTLYVHYYSPNSISNVDISFKIYYKT